jgi:hypothetical protein
MQISVLQELDLDKNQREKASKTLFKEIGGPDSQTVIFQKSLLKLNFAPGS